MVGGRVALGAGMAAVDDATVGDETTRVPSATTVKVGLGVRVGGISPALEPEPQAVKRTVLTSSNMAAQEWNPNVSLSRNVSIISS